MKTTVINLFAGPGVGKSTTAADLFASMKKDGLDVELVREYVKNWIWDGKNPGMYDQAYIFGKQFHAESRLYGKVKYIITDSPFLLSPFYEAHDWKTTVTFASAFEATRLAEKNGVTFWNFFLERWNNYDPKGRRQSLHDALKVDRALLHFLNSNKVPFYRGIKTTEDIREIMEV